jgi:hypothetical protein
MGYCRLLLLVDNPVLSVDKIGLSADNPVIVVVKYAVCTDELAHGRA